METKMNILITCQFFNYYSGSALYNYELACRLKTLGHTVTILSDIGGEIGHMALKNGIQLTDFTNVFDIQDESYDVCFGSQYEPCKIVHTFFPSVPIINIIHSELNIEKPFIRPSNIKYVGVRPAIVAQFHDLHPTLIWNGIDFTRFNTHNQQKIAELKAEKGMTKKILLFVGTVDYLRQGVLQKVAKECEESNGSKELWVVGKNFGFTLPESVKVMPETFFIEKWTEMCDETIGIMLGRTTIEGWACNKPGRMFIVDEHGIIISETVENPPQDMTQFDIITMVDTLLALTK